MNTSLHPRCPLLAAVLAALTQLSTLNPQPCLAQTNCVQCPSGVIAWWTGDGSGTNLAGSGNGTLQSGATYAAGKVGQAFNLGGASDYISVPSSPALHSDRQLTVMGWFRANALSPEWQTVFWKGNTPDCTTSCENREYGMWINQGGYLHFASTPADRIGVDQLTANTPAGRIVAGQWYHFAGVINSDANTMAVFVNGTNAVTTTYSTAGIRTSTGALHLGVTAGGGNQFNGLLDEVAIFNRALSSNEIAAIYAAGTNGMCKDALPPTLLTWPTNQFVALGSNVTLTATASATPPFSYQWRFHGTNLPAATNSSFVILNSSLAHSGPYTVLVSNALGTANSPTAVITVAYMTPGAYWDASDDYSINYNPNGVWSYCRKWSVEGTAADVMTVRWGGSGWYLGNVGHGGPSIQSGPILWAKNNSNGYPAARWRAPKRGIFSVGGRFRGADSRGVDSYVYVVVNGTIVFAGRVQGYQQAVAFALGPMSMDAGALVDFVVVWAGGVYSEYSWTGLDALITSLGCEAFNSPESFEIGWGDWFASGPLQWEVGKPTYGPPVGTNGQRAFSYTNCAATLLGGNYSANSSGQLITPSFTVPAVNPGDLVVFRFRQWYQYGTGDSGQVQISSWNGMSWNPWTTLLVAATNGTSTNWQRVFLDLTQWQGQKVRLGFLHTANSDGSVGAGWYLDDLELSSFVPTPLTLDVFSTNRFTANGQYQYFVLRVPPGGHLRVTLADLDHLGANELYIKRGSLPSPGNYDYRFKINGAADQTAFAPDAGAGDWYVLAYNSTGPVPGDYTLNAQFSTGVMLETITPNALGNSAPGTVEIAGAGFTPEATVALFGGGHAYPSSDVAIVSSSRILADFDFTAIPANTYALRVTAGTNSSELPFTVTTGGQPGLVTKLIVPRTVGYHQLATIYAEYSNTGQVAVLAPILEVSAQQLGKRGAILTLNEHRLSDGFWTYSMPEGFSSSVQFLASGKTPGILQPGESGRVPIYYAGWRFDMADWNYSTIYWNLSVLGADNTNVIAWDGLYDYMRPSNMSREEWTPVFRNLMLQIGATWGDYVRALDNNARYLAKLGVNVFDIRDLLSFEMQQASGLTVTRTLASALDAQVQAPGLPITFTRSFSTDIPSHFRLGRFGYGWSDNWDYSLTNAPDGTVTIFGPSGSRRVFQPDSRDLSRYFAQPGDYATLTAQGGGVFTLQEAAGTRYRYSGGKLQSIQDLHANTITCSYSGNQLTLLTHSAGPWLQLNYTGGRVTSMVDSVGRQTLFAYDGAAEHLLSVTDYRGLTTTYQYNGGVLPNAATAHALTDVGKPDGTHQIYTYDAQGRLASKSGCCGSKGLTTYAYDSAGKVTATDCLTNVSTYWLDHRGALAKSQDPLGHVTLRTYDANGQLVKVTDPAGRIRTYDYDDRGNLAMETDTLGYPTRYTYHPTLNRLATVRDANGNPTHYHYEPDGDLASIVNAANLAESWAYDAQGNRVAWTNRRGQTITYTNDSLGRVIARRYPDGTLHTFRYDARGNLTNYTDATGSTSQEFDAHDRLTKITYPGGYWLSYTYDTAGRRASMTDHLGHRTDYHYGADGRLQSLTDETAFEIVRYEYDLAGRMSRKTLGNGVYTTYAYDAAGQLLDLFNHQTNGAVLSRFQYTYDSRGRRVTMTTTYGAGDPRTNLMGLWRYDYDDTGQLIGWTAPWGRRVDYTYDGLGNRLLVRDNGTNIAYAVNNLNQYTQVGSTTYQYDADGNLTNKVAAEGITAFGWTADNKMAQMVGPGVDWLNVYDGQGNRRRIQESGVLKNFVIDPAGLGNVVGEYQQGSTLPLARFEHGAGLASRRDSSGTPSFYGFDALGSTSEVLANSATPESQYAAGPFGEVIHKAETVEQPFQFVGEFGVMVWGGGLHSMRARHYSPDLGRFFSQDPMNLRSGDINFYRYVRNRVTARSDPSGLCELGIGKCFTSPSSLPWTCLVCLIPPISESPMLLQGCLELCGAYETASTARCIADEYGKFAECCMREGCTGGGNPNGPFTHPAFQCEVCPDCPGCPADPYHPSQPSRPTDPNELLGPGGYGAQNFVAAGSLLPYRINFENYSNATAPAQFVYVTNQLSPNLDLATLELASIGFGDRFFAIPSGSQHYERTETLTMDGFRFQVQIEAGLNLATRTVYARFQSLNPTNGLPPPVEIGFLPPENGTGRGQGHLSYVVRPKTNLVTGTEIRNIAQIKFDLNPPIGTDWVDPHDASKGIDTNKQALVTIDATPPTSVVTNVASVGTNATLIVSWTGTDAGAGVAGYDVHAQTNGGPWGLWLANYPGTSALFPGQNGKTYCFQTIARDGVGLVQTTPAPLCAQTLPNYPPMLAAVSNRSVRVGGQLVITNAAYDPEGPLTFALGAGAPFGATITPDGIFKWTPTCAQGSTTNLIRIWATDSGTPPMSNSISFTVTVPECIEASLGNTVMQAGQAGGLPIYLLSTVELTNFSFTVAYPPERFWGLAVFVNTQQIAAPRIQHPAPGLMRVGFDLPASRVLHGPTNVARLLFTATNGQPSGFAWFEIQDVDGLKPDGNLVGNAYGYPGRVAVIGPQPLLEAVFWTNGQPALLLYAPPNTASRLETTPALNGGIPWAFDRQVPATNELFQVIQPVLTTNRTLFFRAVR